MSSRTTTAKQLVLRDLEKASGRLDVRFLLAGLYESTGAYDKAREELRRYGDDQITLDALLAAGRVEY